jgi:teichuronic acid biosynthesis glycosyltransferase TuaH
MIKGRDIIIIGLSPWHFGIGSNCKSIARQMSLHNRVLYVNMPLDRKTILNGKDDPEVRRHLGIIKQKDPDDLVEIEPNIWNYYPHTILESLNWIPFTPLFSLFNRINNRRFAADLRQVTRRLGFKDYILFNDNDIFRSIYLKKLLDPSLYIYYSRDYLVGVDYWKKHGLSLEPRHIAGADIAVANSQYLTKYLRRYNPNSFYIGQGCDIALFDAARTYTLPEDMKDLPHPIIGYIGAISSLRIDEAVIKEIAVKSPHFHIVLIGPEDPYFQRSDLHSFPNIHFLGRKPIGELPSYSAFFDVCINPQLLNPITIGNYPLKVDEYLAMGKPVVATRTEALDIFEGNIYIADTPADYPGLIDKAIAEDNHQLRQQRISLAHTHTWENSVGKIYAAIEKTVSN